MRVLSLVCFLIVVQVCRADLIGTTVTGTIEAVTFPFNYFDPAIGFVPATGFQNSPSEQDSATVTIVGGNEFGSLARGATVSFNSTGFTLTYDTNAFGPDQITLTDTAFDSVDLVSNTFPGLNYDISGDVITIDLPLTFVPPSEFSATFNVNTPEPSGVVWIVLGGFVLALWQHGLRRTEAT